MGRMKNHNISFNYAHELIKWLDEHEDLIEIIAITESNFGYTLFYKNK